MDNDKKLLGQPTVKKFHALKIISLIIYIAITTYLIIGLSRAKADNDGLSLAAFLVLGVMILGVIGNVLAVIPAIIGFVYTALKFKVEPKRWQLAIFALLTALPIITELLFIIIVSNL